MAQTPVAINGALRLVGNQLSNEKGYPVQLRGLSSHGLQWFGGCINGSSIPAMQQQWNADIVRIAMYVDEGGYLADTAGNVIAVKQMVDWAIAAGMYVIIDWHILTPGNPLKHTAKAKAFFNHFSNLYKNTPNVLYEICNEPNGGTTAASEWNDWIRPYAMEIIPVIRANSPNAIILVGTPQWSSKVGEVYNNPLPPNLATNCLYSFHFYGGSHFTQSYISSFTDKLPIFATEWGVSSYSGNGGNNYINSQEWLDLFAGNNSGSQLISWCNWSFSDKGESSAALTSCGGTYTNRTASGDFVWNNLHNPPRNFIGTVPTSPVLVVQPFPATISKGTSASFKVKAVGSGTLTYQWYFNGSPIALATNEELKIDQALPSDTGSYSVLVANVAGHTSSRTVKLSFNNQAPWSSSPQLISGIIEFENYDKGGEGIAYHDLNTISTDDGADSTLALVGIDDNEWVEYTVAVSKSGFYKISYLLKTEELKPKFSWSVDGKQLSGIFALPDTKYSWKTITDPDTVWIDQGTRVLRLMLENGGALYLDRAIFTYLNIDCNGEENGTASIDMCGICSGGNTGVAPAKDSDGDGTYDCIDLCPNDPLKTKPGVCGCSVVDGTCRDCAGVVGGSAVIDLCGVCSGGTSGVVANTSCRDCFGIINGLAKIDNCNVCSGGTTGIVPDASCTDCAGELNGSASIDLCYVCSGGSTGKTPNASCSDCEGVPNGTAVIDACGKCGGDGRSCIGTLTPYRGVRHHVPGKIEVEDFDAGGPEVAYHESQYSPTNEGGDYRPDEGVDIDALKNGGYGVGWFNDGEWIHYSIAVKHTGNYTLRVRNGTPTSGLKFALLIDSSEWSGTMTAKNTGSYDKFDTTIASNLHLEAGNHLLTLDVKGDGYNIDWFEIVAEFPIDCQGIANGTAFVDDCNSCVGGSTGLSACSSQRIALSKGWNIISLNVVPSNSSPASVFSSIAPQLDLIKNNTSFFSPSTPPQMNSLISIVPGQAYFVKMNAASSLVVTGSMIPESLPSLSPGWNLVGCPYQSSTPFSTSLAGSNIKIVKDFHGFWIPSGTMNSISSFEPGKGYLIKK